jgi:hypothetical protein
MKKFDLTGAFLIADMDKPIYVQIPGYDLPKDKAILLKKALYGTKNAGALYSKEIKKWLAEYGFKATTVDETLFRLTRVKNGKTSTLLISLYVDDGACCTNDEELYQEFLTALQDKYELSDSGDLTWHLGINVTQDPQAGMIAFDQTAYIESASTWKAARTSTLLYHPGPTSRPRTLQRPRTRGTSKPTSNSWDRSCTLRAGRGRTSPSPSTRALSSCRTLGQATSRQPSTSCATSRLPREQS